MKTFKWKVLFDRKKGAKISLEEYDKLKRSSKRIYVKTLVYLPVLNHSAFRKKLLPIINAKIFYNNFFNFGSVKS